MKRVFLALTGMLAATALVLSAVTCLLYGTMPDYPDGIGSDPNVTLKITGEYLVKASAETPDTLLVFGSSELKTTDICTHPANFFADRRCGFRVDLIGRGSCQSLVHAMSIAAAGEAVNGKKVVLITAPQSYVEEGIAPDLFMANFSEQQTLSFLSDRSIPAHLRQYLASRISRLRAQYLETYGEDPLRGTAAGLLSDAAAEERGTLMTILKPYTAVSRWLLDTKDLVSARRIMPAYTDSPSLSRQIRWEEEEEAALLQAHEMSTNNDFAMQDDYYSTYIGQKLPLQEGRDAGLSYAESPEYDDLRCLLALCAAKDMEVLFVHVPMHGAWYDYTGFDAASRAVYYDRVREIAESFDNVTVLDLTQREYEPYFLCDTMHLGWKGWLEVDRAMVAFYGSDA